MKFKTKLFSAFALTLALFSAPVSRADYDDMPDLYGSAEKALQAEAQCKLETNQDAFRECMGTLAHWWWHFGAIYPLPEMDARPSTWAFYPKISQIYTDYLNRYPSPIDTEFVSNLIFIEFSIEVTKVSSTRNLQGDIGGLKGMKDYLAELDATPQSDIDAMPPNQRAKWLKHREELRVAVKTLEHDLPLVPVYAQQYLTAKPLEILAKFDPSKRMDELLSKSSLSADEQSEAESISQFYRDTVARVAIAAGPGGDSKFMETATLNVYIVTANNFFKQELKALELAYHAKLDLSKIGRNRSEDYFLWKVTPPSPIPDEVYDRDGKLLPEDAWAYIMQTKAHYRILQKLNQVQSLK